MATRNHLVLFLNGKRREVHGGDCFLSLSDYLRYRCGLVGTKIVCSEGDCGSCTVLIGRPEGKSLQYRPVDSCIQWMFQLDGTHVDQRRRPRRSAARRRRQTRRERRSHSRAASDGQLPRLTVRLLHPGLRDGHDRHLRRQQRPRPNRGRLASRPDWQPLPLHRLHSDHQRRFAGRHPKNQPS